MTYTHKTLNELPLELLDIILESSFLHWILNSSPNQRDKDVIKSLALVDFCWFQRITRRRFKKRILQWLKDFYGQNKKRSAIIRNNQHFLLANIQLNSELINLLLSYNCLTKNQSHQIQRQRSDRAKNAELLHVVRSFDDTKYSNFLTCLRQTNQKTVARIIENGGGVIKVEVQNRGATRTTSDDTDLHQTIEDLQNRIKPIPPLTNKIVSWLKDEGMEIVNCQLDTQTLIVWIWGHSQAAIENIQKLYDSNQLTEVLFSFSNPRPSSSEIIQSKAINIDSNQFKKTFVVYQIYIDFTERLDIGTDVRVMGVTKLRNEIYALCRSDYSSSVCVIRVFEDRNRFHYQKKIEIKEIKDPTDIGSSKKKEFICVTDIQEKCIWKITRETDDQHKVIKWLTTNNKPHALSMSTDDQLLIVYDFSSILEIYGSDAELLCSIQLPELVMYLIHAVETSIGNFIILHLLMEKEEDDEFWPSRREKNTKWGIWEVTRDEQKIIRRFIPTNKIEELFDPSYLSLDSDDRVFVADTMNGRVILLDSDLNWNRILCPTEEEERRIWPDRLCYDEENKQLITVGGVSANVYSLNRK